MKDIYVALLTVLSTAAVSFSQVEIRLFEGGVAVGPDVSGTVVEMVATTDDIYAKTFSVQNTSGASASFKVTRFRLSAPPAWKDGLCWGPFPDANVEGQCFSYSQMATNPWTTPNEASMNASVNGNMVVDIHTEGAGYAHYRYYILQGSSVVDSVDLGVSSTLSVPQQQPQQEEPVSVSAYPNPANSQLTIATTGLESAQIRITDVLGKLVYEETTSSTKKIDVSDFKNGVYLVTVLEKGKAIQTKRVVVKH
jgi:hypothetical protein